MQKVEDATEIRTVSALTPKLFPRTSYNFWRGLQDVEFRDARQDRSLVAFRRDDSIAEAGKCQFLRRNDASDEFEDFLA